MAVVYAVQFVLFLAMVAQSSGNWCVCKSGLSDAVLQKTLDYACGAGADCNPIRPNGQCYNPASVRTHCSFAVNSYYQRKIASGATCDFGGTAALTASDPSVSGCSYPSSASSAGTSTPKTGSSITGTTTVPTTTPVTGTGMGTRTPTTTSPYTGMPTTTANPTSTTPSTGVLNGVGSGLGPSGSSMDDSSMGFNTRNMNHSQVAIAVVFITTLVLVELRISIPCKVWFYI